MSALVRMGLIWSLVTVYVNEVRADPIVAQKHEEYWATAPKLPEPTPLAARITEIELSLGTGYEKPWGNAPIGTGSMGQWVPWVIPIELGFAIAVERRIAVGVYAAAVFGAAAPSVRVPCENAGLVSCSAAGARVGLQFQTWFAKDASIARAWVRYAIGLDMLGGPAASLINGGEAWRLGVNGYELARLEVGLSQPLDSTLALEPYLGASVGHYTARFSRAGEDRESPEFASGWHGWLFAGVRITAFY